MRVVHYCQAFSELSETAIYTWIVELQRQGVDCQVLAHRRLHEEERPFAAVHTVPLPHNTDLDRLAWRVMEALGRTTAESSWYTTVQKRMAKALRQLRPDVLHVHFGNNAWQVAPAAQAVGVPLIVTFHGYDISELVKQEMWRRRYREELWPTIEFATVLSEEMREAVIQQGCPPEKIRIVRIGRDIRPVMEGKKRSDGTFHLVSVGRLTEKKGHIDAIGAVERLVAQGQDVRLRIFGSGKLRDELGRLITDRDLDASVYLEGPRPNDEILTALQEADAFLLCSKTAPNGDREGTPNVLVEAQGAGLPCISTRHAGIPEMIPEENHWLLAEEGDVEGIARRTAELMNLSPEERRVIGMRGHEKMSQDYDLATECLKFRALYAAAVSEVVA